MVYEVATDMIEDPNKRADTIRMTKFFVKRGNAVPALATNRTDASPTPPFMRANALPHIGPVIIADIPSIAQNQAMVLLADPSAVIKATRKVTKEM